jgi:aspartate racemase
MKKAGIIGGIGPASTLDYYSGIINGVRARAKDGSYPEIVINSIDMTAMLAAVENEAWGALADMLLRAIEDLANAGAAFAAIASNTPHIVFDRVQARAPLPLISIVDAACRYARAAGSKKALVIGTRFTMRSGLYSGALAKYGIAAAVPSEEQQEAIHGLFFPNLENGVVIAEDKRKMLAIVGSLLAEHRADTLVLGCTELPLMIRDGDADAMVLNATQVHIDAIVEAVLWG